MKKSIRMHARAFAPALSVLSLAVAASVQAQGIEVNPVVVSATRIEQPLSEVSVVVDVISRQQIEQSGASNIAEFLDSVGGMNVNRLYGRSGVDATVDAGYLGQAGSQNVLILIDGQRVSGADSSGSKFAQLPMSAIKQIEIRKANGGVLYGDRAQGGVINIITRTDSVKSVDLNLGSFGYQKQDAYLGLQDHQTRGSVSLMNAKSDGYRQFSESDQRSAQVRVARATEIGKFSFFARGFEENAKLPSYLTKSQFVSDPRRIGAYPVSTERSGAATGLNYERALDGNDLFSIDTFHQELKDKTYNTIKNIRSSINPEYKTTLVGNQMVFGGEFADAQANTDSGKHVQQQTNSIFAQAVRPLTTATSMDVGIRSQRAHHRFQTSSGAVATSAQAEKTGVSAGLLSQLTASSSLRAGALSGFRFPNADELYFFGRNSPYPLLEINPNVKPMETREYFLQYEQRYASGKYAVHYRHINATDEIAYQYSCGTVGGVAASCNSNLYDTERSILSINTDWKLSPTSSVKGVVDFVDATIANGTNAGRRIPLTPRKVIRLTHEQKINDYEVMTSAHHRSNMVQASDQSGSYEMIPSRTVVDLGVSKPLSPTVSGAIWLRNLFDKSYYDYAAYNGFYPADGRGIFASLKASF